jgi:hypothetical protein
LFIEISTAATTSFKVSINRINTITKFLFVSKQLAEAFLQKLYELPYFSIGCSALIILSCGLTLIATSMILI